MLGSNYDISGYKKEIRRLERNLKDRASRIESRGNSALQFMPQQLKDVLSNRPNMRTADIEELRSYYRQLANIENSRYHTVKEAERGGKLAQKLSKAREKLTPAQQDAMFTIFGKLYGLTSSGINAYKYEVFNVLFDYAEETVADFDDEWADMFEDELIENVFKKFDALSTKYGGNYYDENFQNEFIQYIQDFRDIFS